MTAPVPVPAGILSSDFPMPADRTAGVFNSKAVAWANSARDMSERDREIAVATHTNAVAAKEGADAAASDAATAATARNESVAARNESVTARNESVTARNESVTARNESVAARNAAVLAAEDALDAAERAEDAAASIADGPVTSVNGQTGVVSLQIQDIPGLTDLVRLQRVEVTANAALGAAQIAQFLDCKGAITLSVPSLAALGAGWYCYLRNTGNGDITIDPDDAEQIDGQLTYTLKPGFTVLLQYDGTDFTVVELKKRTYDRRVQINSTQDFIVPPDTYVIRAYAVGAGGDGGAAVASTSSGAGGSGGGMAYGDIAVTPGETLSVSIASRTAKVSRGATDLLVGNPAAHSVNKTPGAVGTASKHASVTNGGAYSGGLGGAGFTGASAAGSPGASSGSPLGAGVNGLATNSAFAVFGGSGWGGNAGVTGGTRGGGGVGGPAVGSAGGPGLPHGQAVTEPLLFDCVAPINANNPLSGAQSEGLPGQGGVSANPGGHAGFGGGGGGGSTGSGLGGGHGGFGGGGGACPYGADAIPGNGGYGGGGAGGSVSAANTRPPGTGGPAAVIIIY